MRRRGLQKGWGAGPLKGLKAVEVGDQVFEFMLRELVGLSVLVFRVMAREYASKRFRPAIVEIARTTSYPE